MVFHWSLSDHKSPQVSRTLLGILADVKKCCSFDNLNSSRYFQIFQSLYQSFGDCTKGTNYNWYNRHFHVPLFFPIP